MPTDGKRFFSWSAEFEWPRDGSGISAFLCRQGLKAIVAARQTPFGAATEIV
jgi:hypothetical protein